jgi:hypothetical protein
MFDQIRKIKNKTYLVLTLDSELGEAPASSSKLTIWVCPCCAACNANTTFNHHHFPTVIQ